jgi:hypothetical protein
VTQIEEIEQQIENVRQLALLLGRDLLAYDEERDRTIGSEDVAYMSGLAAAMIVIAGKLKAMGEMVRKDAIERGALTLPEEGQCSTTCLPSESSGRSAP